MAEGEGLAGDASGGSIDDGLLGGTKVQDDAGLQSAEVVSYPVVVNDLHNHSDVAFAGTGLEEHDWGLRDLSFRGHSSLHWGTYRGRPRRNAGSLMVGPAR